jgi:non-specific serine/threonine protein kinase/serine/threonine-protein kinase
MNDKSSAFGADPEQIDKLLAWPLDEDVEETQTASLHRFVEGPGSQIGRYKLLSVLGEGGMGIVYLAEQEGQIRRKVALKVIKPGMDSKRVIARFETERQALALLDHPNIAQVYDAGTTESGRPYFVMEHVKGSPITEYCDRHKLSIEDRLTLFQEVCAGLQHAHQKGIIHRDIKPSNILVSAGGDKAIPKIIDFGVAKAMAASLTERTLFTEASQLLGTPEYMSPEQADMANEDIDTRSDIYSLGVLLYVLLTGVLPFDTDTLRTGGIEDIRKVICETDPKTPSTRVAKLGEEATSIAESRRTELAELAKCLHRELEWIPLKAMRKDRAERYRSAVELADDIGNYLDGDPLMAGPPTTLYRFKKFVQRNTVLSTAVLAVGVTLVLGLTATTAMYLRSEEALGKEARALTQAQEATQRATQAATEAEQAKQQAEQAAENAKQNAEREAAARVEAERARDEAQTIFAFLKDTLRSARNITGREAMVLDVLGSAQSGLEEKFIGQPLVEKEIRVTLSDMYFDLGYFKSSLPQRERACHICLEQLGEGNRTTQLNQSMLATAYHFSGKYREAEKLRLQQRYLDGFSLGLGVVYSKQGRYVEAEQAFVEAWEGLGWDPNYIQTTYSWEVAKVYREQGRYKKAEELFRRTLEAQHKKWGEKGDGTWACKIRCMNELARLYVIQERYDDANDLFIEGIALGERTLAGKDHPFTLRHINGLGVLRTRQGRYGAAEVLLNRALEGRKLKLGADHPYTLETINDLGILHRQQQHYEKAEEFLNKALEGRKAKLDPDHPHTLQSMHELAVLYVKQDQHQQAVELLIKVAEGRLVKLGDKHPHTQESIKTLIELYKTLNQPEAADKWRAARANQSS